MFSPVVELPPRRLFRVICCLAGWMPAALWAEQVPRALRSGPSDLADLPDAPSMSLQQEPSAVKAETSSGVTGTITDAQENPIALATVSLEGPRPGEPSAHSDAAGHFSIVDLPPGRYRVLISAPGFEDFEVPEVTLHPEKISVLSKLVLRLESSEVSVEVRASQKEIAQEQLQIEVKQRFLGVLPNFYTSYMWKAAPLDTRQKFSLAAHSILDPAVFVVTGFAAGLEHYNDVFPAYGGGFGGYAQRYAADYGDELSVRMLSSAVFPSLLHQDPRYFYKGIDSKKDRAAYAVTRTFVTRGDDGKDKPNYSRILGVVIAAGLSNAYHLDGDRGAGLTFRTIAIGFGGNAADNLLKEFLFKRFTTNVP